MAKLKDTDLMPIGKFRGQALINVPDWHLKWLLEQKWITDYPDLHAYLIENKDVIEKNVQRDRNIERNIR